MIRHQTINRSPHNHRRGGVTISEVLISMVIMGVGVVSLATLFPASVLRSIQASQLTNSALLSKNARSRIVYDTTVLNNTRVPLTNSSLDPTNAPAIGFIDPFGSLNNYGLPNTIAGIAGLPRIAGGWNNQLYAESLALLPDSWSLVRQDPVNGGYSSGSYQVTLAASADSFTDITPRTLGGSSTTNPLYRLTLLDATGRYSYRRTLRQVLNGNQLSWQDPNGSNEPDLPSGFVPARCRVEVRDNRYTWMLTVRKRPLDSTLTSWKGDADLVVFFNRSFKAADEVSVQMSTLSPAYGFDGAPGFAGVNDDFSNSYTDWIPPNNNADPNEVGWPGSDDNRTLSFSGPIPPLLKKGGFLLEPSQARWYRVIDISFKESTNTGKVLLDRDLVDLPQNPPFPVVLMKGIVQVYELGTFSGSQ